MRPHGQETHRRREGLKEKIWALPMTPTGKLEGKKCVNVYFYDTLCKNVGEKTDVSDKIIKDLKIPREKCVFLPTVSNLWSAADYLPPAACFPAQHPFSSSRQTAQPLPQIKPKHRGRYG